LRSCLHGAHDAFLSPALDIRILLFCLALSVGAGILFGAVSIASGSKPDLVDALKDQSGQTTSTRAANFFRKALVTAQVAISCCCSSPPGSLPGTLLNLRRVELGIQIDHLLTFSLVPKLNSYTTSERRNCIRS